MDHCHRAKNNIGFTSWFCKNVWCTPPMEHYLGSHSQSDWDSGKLYDNGGPAMHYGNNRNKKVDYFTINTSAEEAELIIHFMRFADTNDRLKVYQGLGDTGKALHPVGGFTKGNIPALPSKLRSKTGTFFITFESNGSGTDSGFVISWNSNPGIYDGKGFVYFDHDTDCVFDNNSKERYVPNLKIKIGKKQVLTQVQDGFYQFRTDSSSKVIEPILPQGWYVSCPASGKDTWTSTGNKNVNFAILADPSKPRLDLSHSAVAAAGFTTVRGIWSRFYVYSINQGNKIIDSAICRIKASRKLVGFKLNTGTYQATDTSLTFKIGKLDYFDFQNKTVEYLLSNTDTGYLTFKTEIFPLGSGNADSDSSNNYAGIKLGIVNAHDPNDKQVSEKPVMDKKDPVLQYFVRFQNTGTAPATDVIVRDTLSPLLDTNTIEFTSSSHAGFMERKGYALAFKFLGINLQDSNHNEPMSHGYFYYNVKPVAQLKPHQKIKNTAHIYFDAEKPVVTNTTENMWVSPPQVTPNGGDGLVIGVCDTYFEAGAVALDVVDGSLNDKIKIISNYKNGVPGKYKIIYYAVNSFGDTGWAYRTFYIKDFEKPHLRRAGKNIVNNMVVKVPLNSSFIDSVKAIDSCLGEITYTTTNTAGAVNTTIRGSYPIQYFATDAAGNIAWENGYTINYLVDDIIPPTIELNTADTVCHQINTAYTPVNPTVNDNYYPKGQISITKKGAVDPFVAGLYTETYTATDGSGNTATKTRIVKVADCLGLKVVYTNIGALIGVYPNPANDILTLHTKGIEPQSLYIQITTLTGKVIYASALESGQTAINIQNWASGAYLIVVTCANHTYSSKILVQHP